MKRNPTAYRSAHMTLIAAAIALSLAAALPTPVEHGRAAPSQSAAQPSETSHSAAQPSETSHSAAQPSQTFNAAAQRFKVGAPRPRQADTSYETLARITYYTEAGVMASGLWTFPGAAACSDDLPLGTAISIAGDRYVCLDRGLLTPTWVDIFAPDGASWVPQTYGDYAPISIDEVTP